jgi:hypothetical protein
MPSTRPGGKQNGGALLSKAPPRGGREATRFDQRISFAPVNVVTTGDDPDGG